MKEQKPIIHSETLQISQLIKKDKGFVLYSYKPQNKNTTLLSDMECNTISSYAELENKSGFIFAPFNPDKHPIYFLNQSKGSTVSTKQKSKSETYTTNKSDFIKQVDSILKEINTTDISKIVLSKTFTHPFTSSDVLIDVFNQMCEIYPTAFNYIVFIPNEGLWIGASPEPLLIQDKNNYQTVSLAGTQTNKGSHPVWQHKELEEQNIVSNYIVDKLNQLCVENLKKSITSTFATGNLFHLKTDFHFNASPSKIGELIDILHPTPSICGMPENKAFDYINNIEKHDREYYTGILGPVNTTEKSMVFVNLRCLKISNSQATFYAGAGITAESEPEKEWQETELKLDIMRKMIL